MLILEVNPFLEFLNISYTFWGFIFDHMYRFIGCNVIKTGNFTACHKAVNPDSYIEACQQETCLCKFGGDCACFCSAVGAYVQECNRVGIPVYWRREGLCSKCLSARFLC